MRVHDMKNPGCGVQPGYDYRLHDLRRTLGSWQAAGGASLLIIGKSLGHRSESATRIYARLATDPVRESVEKATVAMIAAAGSADLFDGRNRDEN